MVMSSSSSCCGGGEVLHTVIKEFSNEDRKRIEIALVRHVDNDCLEIIGFDSVKNQETNRIYVSLKKIRSKLSRKVVDEETSRLESEGAAPKTQSQKLNKAMTDLTIDYLLSRINYRTSPAQSNQVLYLSGGPESTEDSDIVIPTFQYEQIPDGVVPYQVMRSGQSVRLTALDILNLGSSPASGSPQHPRKSSPAKVIHVPARPMSPSWSSSGGGPADNSYSAVSAGSSGYPGGEQLLANDHSNLVRMDVWTSALPDDDEEQGDDSGAAAAAPPAAAGRNYLSRNNNDTKMDSTAKHSSLRRRSFEAAAQLAQRVLPSQLVPLVLGTRSLDHTSDDVNHTTTGSPVKGGLEGSLPRLEPHGSGSSAEKTREPPKRRNTYSLGLPSRVEPEQLLHLPRTHRVARGGGNSEASAQPNGRNRRTLDDDLAARHNIKQQQQQQQQSRGEGVSGMNSARHPEEEEQQEQLEQEEGETAPLPLQSQEGTRKQQGAHPHHKKKLSYHLLKNYY